MALEKTLESPLDWKEIKPVNPKGNQSWIFIGTTDTEAEAPILWPPDAKNWLIRKHCEAWKDWRQEEEGTTEDEIVEWHHRLYGHEFEQGLGVGDGQGSLVCCKPWGCIESDRTERLYWTELLSTAGTSGTLLKMSPTVSSYKASFLILCDILTYLVHNWWKQNAYFWMTPKLYKSRIYRKNKGTEILKKI